MKKKIEYIVLILSCILSMNAISTPVKSILAGRSCILEESKETPLPPLPEGLHHVEYLESTGTQWIDTGVIADIKTIVTVDFYHGYDGLNQSQVVILGRVINGTSYKYQLLVRCPNGYKNTLTFEANILLTSYGYWGSSGRSIVVMNSDCLIDVNGVKNGNPVRETRTTSDTFKLLYHPEFTYSGFVGKLYSVKIETVDGEVLQDMVPVRFMNENDEVEGAMYDFVSGNLFRNQGTGSFIIGPDKTNQ